MTNHEKIADLMQHYTMAIKNQPGEHGKIEYQAILIHESVEIKKSNWMGAIEAHLQSLEMLNEINMELFKQATNQGENL